MLNDLPDLERDIAMLNGSPWIAGRIAFARGEAEGLFDGYLMEGRGDQESPISENMLFDLDFK